MLQIKKTTPKSSSQPISITSEQLRMHRHIQLNCFRDTETLVQCLGNRPGFAGTNPLAYLAILARRPQVRFVDLQEALAVDKTLMRAGAFRGGLFLLTSHDYPMYLKALGPVLRHAGMSLLAQHNIHQNTLDGHAERLQQESWNNECLEAPKILAFLYPHPALRPQGDIGGLLLRKLCDMGVLVRIKTKGIQSNQFLYGLMHEWHPDVLSCRTKQQTAQTQRDENW